MDSLNHLRRQHRQLRQEMHGMQQQRPHSLRLVAKGAGDKESSGAEPRRLNDDNGDVIVENTRTHPRRVGSTEGCYQNMDFASNDLILIDCIRDPNHPNRNMPTVSPTFAPTMSSDTGPELHPGVIAALVIFGMMFFVLCAICSLSQPSPRAPSSSSSTYGQPPPAIDWFGRRRQHALFWAVFDPPHRQVAPPRVPTRRPQRPGAMTANHHRPGVGGAAAANTSGPRPNATAHTSTAATQQPLSPHQQAVNLVKSMTPSERRDYVANFLRTQKYVEPDDTETTAETSASAKFIVSQSTRILNPNANEPAAAAASCAICLDEFEDGEDICSSQNAHCPHQFHLTCAFEWLLSSQECPCCRRDYLTIGQVLSSRRLAAPAPTGSAASTPASNAPALPEMAPTAPTESDLPAEADLPVESEAEILPVAAAANDAPSNDRLVGNALTPQEILRRSVAP